MGLSIAMFDDTGGISDDVTSLVYVRNTITWPLQVQSHLPTQRGHHIQPRISGAGFLGMSGGLGPSDTGTGHKPPTNDWFIILFPRNIK